MITSFLAAVGKQVTVVTPDQPVPRPKLRSAASQIWGIDASVVGPLSWQPILPTYQPARRLHRTFLSGLVEVPPGADLQTAQLMSWDTREKAPFVQRPRLRVGGATYTTPPSVPGADVTVTTMRQDAITTTTILTAAGRRL